MNLAGFAIIASKMLRAFSKGRFTVKQNNRRKIIFRIVAIALVVFMILALGVAAFS